MSDNFTSLRVSDGSYQPDTQQHTTLRDRIAAVIYDASDDYTKKLMVRPDCPGASEVEGSAKPICYTLADALIRDVLTPEWLSDLVIAAIQTAADNE